MGLKQGYKQTDVGVIPEDWDVYDIDNVSSVVRGGSPRPAGDPKYFNGNFIPWLTVASLTNISETQIYVSKTASHLTEEGSKRSRILEAGTVIIANSGATLGVAKILQIRCCANDGIAVLSELNETAVDKRFICYFINSITNDLREAVATGNGQPNLNTGLIGGIRFPYPPLQEQQAIAEALSDVDAQLSALDALIAKKREIKQGAMQDLLTGQRRLPGFDGEWERISIGDHSQLKARIGWQGLTTAEYLDSGDYFLVTGTDFVDGRIKWDTCHYVEKWRYDQDRYIQLHKNDVLVTKDGTIGKVAFIDDLPQEATLNSGVFVIRPIDNRYYPLFLYYILTSRIFKEFLNELQAGSTINHLYQKDFVTFEFDIPAIEEQKAISSILFSLDSEISQLEHNRYKTQSIKQGMMQELLTGKTRLV